MDSNKQALILLNMVPALSVNGLRNLLEVFTDPLEIFKAKTTDIACLGRINQPTAEKIKKAPDEFDVEAEINRARQLGINIITCRDAEYPQQLKEIYDYPAVLYTKGDESLLTQHGIGVVGSRRASHYGIDSCRKLCSNLASLGIVICSGLARGIDSQAHRAALEVAGKTTAVLGSGLDVMYPPENDRLAQEITQNGLLVSEFALGTKPVPYNFPRRNRIISGLCFGVLVVEAAQKSGSLITAAQALEQNRTVFAVPGNINSPRCAGTNALIKNGAKLVVNAADILEEIPFVTAELFKKAQGVNAPKLEGNEKNVYDKLESSPLHIDSLIDLLSIDSTQVMTVLFSLELRGLVKSLPGKYFVKNS